MERRIDLHTHTICSDGSMTPRELVRHAKEAGLTAVAVTDHDSVNGLKEALMTGSELAIEVVPGIELSAKSDTECHILGYFIDPDSDTLKSAMRRIHQVRRERIEETCFMLKKHDIIVTLDEVDGIANGGIVSRAHIARLMVKKGYSQSIREAFDLWLNVGCPCYSDAQALSDTEAVELIREAGGDAYLAHLHLTRKEDAELEAFVRKLKKAGLTGIEGYYTEYTDEHNRKYRDLAKRLDLKLSGGTDFHGKYKPHIAIGKGYGNLVIPYSILTEMKNR